MTTDQSEFDALYDALDEDDLGAAREALESLRPRATPHELARAEAAILGAEGELEDAIDVLQKALAEHGDDSRTHVRAAEILLAAEEPRDALTALDLALLDASMEAEIRAYAQVMRATAMSGFGQYHAALEVLEQQVRGSDHSVPLEHEAQRMRAEILAQLDRTDEALAVLDALPEEARDEATHWLRGAILAHRDDLVGADAAFALAREAGGANEPPYRCSKEDMARRTKEALTNLGDLAAIAAKSDIEHRERGAFVVDEEGAGGRTEHGVLEAAYTLGAVDDSDSPVDRRPRAVVLVQRNLENAAGDEDGLRDEITRALMAVLEEFAMSCSIVDMVEGDTGIIEA